MRYHHRQFGRAPLTFLVGGLLLAAGTAFATGTRAVPLPVLVGLAPLTLVAVWLSALTITVDATLLHWTFPLGIFRGQLPVSDIQSIRIVDLHWWEGWGMRFTPTGRLMSVGGRRAVEITTRTDRLRLGSDEPSALLAAVERARSLSPGGAAQ